MSQTVKSKYAQILVDIPNLDTRTFSYLIPDEVRNTLKIGMPVLVPFGNQGAVNGFVVGFGDYLPEGIRAKAIYEVLDDEPLFDLEYLQFIEWVSNYYCCDLPTVINTAIPTGFLAKSRRVVTFNDIEIPYNLSKNELTLADIIRSKPEITVSQLQKKAKIPSGKFYESLRKLKAAGVISIDNVIEGKSAKPKLEKYVVLIDPATDNKRQGQVLEKLKEFGGEYRYSDFLKAASTTASTLKKLAAQGNVEIQERALYRNALKIFDGLDNEQFMPLNSEQDFALERIKVSIDSQDAEPYLLYGVTGSGKTEVYCHAAKYVIEQGKNVIFLAPEIALAGQLAKRISKKFGTDSVAIWHSNLSEGEKLDVWQKLKKNEIKIIIGARSAIFAPILNLGLIIIDEEHESGYKQTSPAPRYNAKDLAYERAKRTGSAVVFGSATPDITTYYRALNTNRVLTMNERYGSGELAEVDIIDMREENRLKNSTSYSMSLIDALRQNLEDGKQSILLVNRRGYSNNVMCKTCGYTVECPKCSIPMIYHRVGHSLRCHYCNHEQPVFEICPQCFSSDIRYYGLGTQKAEEELLRIIPEARVARFDSDIMSKKNADINLIDSFTNGEIDILIGTQMVAKGLDIHNVTLVGVLSADSLFNMPDFRSAERGFQLLTQVAGRAGRGDFKGKVYFQTYNPEFFGLQSAEKQDFMSFYYNEIAFRNKLSYPPYSQIIRLILSSKNDIRARKYSEEIAYKLTLLTESRGIGERLEVLPAAPCIISKIRDEHRFQIIIKNRLSDNGHFMVTNFIKKLPIPQDIKFLIDVDPLDML